MPCTMEEKLQILDSYISKLNAAVNEKNIEKAKALQRETIAVYESEIKLLKSRLDCYSHYFDDYPVDVDYIGDARLLSAKLQNYRANLVSGLYKQFENSDGSVNVTQQVNQDVNTTVTVSLEQTINTINELPSSVLSDEEKDILLGKLASISAEKDKQKRWEKVGNALKWIVEKGIQVGTAALPYIAKALEEGS